MQTLKNLKFIILVTAVFAFHSCVQNSEFEIPVNIEQAFVLGPDDTLTDIGAVLGQYNQQGEIFTYDQPLISGGSRYISGYVVSSDKGGNFFEEIVIQDKAENPTSGIIVQIDVNPLYTQYEFGRKVFIKLDGLSVGESNGVIQLGFRDGDNLAKIPSALRNDFIFRDAEVADIVPLNITISDFSDSKESLYIRLSDAQFIKSQVLGERTLTFASEAGDQFDGERTVESCADNSTVILSTSTFSDFKSLPLPTGKGTLDGVLTRDFFDDFYTIVINSPEDIDFSSDERCDPDVFECDNPINGSSTTTIFSEDFESFGTFNSEGWTNVNVSNGSTDWSEGNFGGNSYAQISGFNASEDPIDVWLVTPAINLDGTTEEVLDFDVQTNFNNGDILTVWVSTDFTGDPTTATWNLLDTSIPTGSASGFGSFEGVPTVNLSCLDGDVHIGFFYQGADPGPTTRYHVDNVEVTGK